MYKFANEYLNRVLASFDNSGKCCQAYHILVKEMEEKIAELEEKLDETIKSGNELIKDADSAYSKLLTSYRLQEDKLHRRNLQIDNIKKCLLNLVTIICDSNREVTLEDCDEAKRLLGKYWINR